MRTKLYFANKPLFLASGSDTEIDEYLHRQDTVFIDEGNDHAVRTMIYEMEQPDVRAGVMLYPDVPGLLKGFQKQLSFIQAAGGLVHTPEGALLLIYRRGKWDLPKGKRDGEESLEDCARREIREETGLEQLELEAPLCTTYHVYHGFGQHVLKETHWFLAQSPDQASLHPQADEDIEQCLWVEQKDLASYLAHTHALILDVMNAGLQQLSSLKGV